MSHEIVPVDPIDLPSTSYSRPITSPQDSPEHHHHHYTRSLTFREHVSEPFDSERLPATLASEIQRFLRIANLVESEEPRIAYLCEFPPSLLKIETFFFAKDKNWNFPWIKTFLQPKGWDFTWIHSKDWNFLNLGLGRFHAFEIAHHMDRNSTGRGVRQFKTSLLQRLEQASLKAFMW